MQGKGKAGIYKNIYYKYNISLTPLSYQENIFGKYFWIRDQINLHYVVNPELDEGSNHHDEALIKIELKPTY